SLGERTSCSIFIDSTTTTRAPRATLAPGSTLTATTLPASGETICRDATANPSARAHGVAVAGDGQAVERDPGAAPRDDVGHDPRGAGRHRPAERAVAGG